MRFCGGKLDGYVCAELPVWARARWDKTVLIPCRIALDGSWRPAHDKNLPGVKWERYAPYALDTWLYTPDADAAKSGALKGGVEK